MSAVDFNSEKDAGVGALDRKAANQRIRKGSFCHQAYPPESRPDCFAHWEGLHKVLTAHKHLLANQNGQAAIFLAESGSGKSTAIKALIHGDTGVKPKRSLTVRFASCRTGISPNGITDEQKVLDNVAHNVGFPFAGLHVNDNELADFLVSAVTKEEKTEVAVPQSILQSISKLGSFFMSMSRGEAFCGGDEEGEDGPLPVKITALPNEDTVPSDKQWPIILFDDVNFDFEQGGLFSNFLYNVAQRANSQRVICYIVTKERRVAYLIWQANGGNWMQPHAAVKEIHDGQTQTLEELAALDTHLLPIDLECLNSRKVPKNWFFKSDPFIFNKEEKETLLWNVFVGDLKTEDRRVRLSNDIENILVKHPNYMINELLPLLTRLDYHYFKNNNP
jgi:hypothetical protein